MGFDDHDEDYVTLNSRGLSKIILDQFAKNKEESQKTYLDGDAQFLISGQEEPLEMDSINSDKHNGTAGFKKSGSKTNVLDKSSRGQKQKTDNASQFQQYERLSFNFNDIVLEHAESSLRNKRSNISAKQITIEQGAKAVLS